jgi:hypothetical protein
MNNDFEQKGLPQTGTSNAGKSKKKLVVFSVLGLTVVVLAILSVVFSDYLLTAVIAPFRVKVTPSKVVQGQSVVVSWPTFNKNKYPLERISFCTVDKKPVCRIVLKSTKNDGKEKIKVPDIAVGTYRVLLQALDAGGKFVSGVKITSNSFRIEQKPSGSNGGGNGQNNNNNNDNDDSNDVDDIDDGNEDDGTDVSPAPIVTPSPSPSIYTGSYTIGINNVSGKQTTYSGVKISDVKVSSDGVSWITTGVKKGTALSTIDDKATGNINCPVSTLVTNADKKYTNSCNSSALNSTNFAKLGKHTFVITVTNRYGTKSYYRGSYEVNSVQSAQQGNQTSKNGVTIGSVVISLTTSKSQPKPIIKWNLQDSVGLKSTSLNLDGSIIEAISGPSKVIPARSSFDANFSGVVGASGLTLGSHKFTISAEHLTTDTCKCPQGWVWDTNRDTCAIGSQSAVCPQLAQVPGYCGCDGKTYVNSCYANLAGVRQGGQCVSPTPTPGTTPTPSPTPSATPTPIPLAVISAPTSAKVGTTITVTWSIDAATATEFPAATLRLCNKNSCASDYYNVSASSKARRAVIYIPRKFPTGDAQLQLTLATKFSPTATKKLITKCIQIVSTTVTPVATVSPSPTDVVAYKPVIYLYPTQEQQTEVKINYLGNLTVTYPDYNNGWHVTAYPDGKLVNQADNKEYSYLFWEGKSNVKNDYDFSSGFVVKGNETATFLQNKLKEFGLTPKEYNEFIVYWLPKMLNNKYNLIHFASREEYDNKAVLNISPKPESVLRVFMVFKKLDTEMKVVPQTTKPFERKGFAVVEWGGTEVE